MQLQVVLDFPRSHLGFVRMQTVGMRRAQVMLEFPMDDAASGEREDALVEMSFYVPKEADGFAGEGEDPSAKVGLPLNCWDYTLCMLFSADREVAVRKTTPVQRCSFCGGNAS